MPATKPDFSGIIGESEKIKSVLSIVEKILEDFRSGKESHAAFWINLAGRFISIEYFAMRDEKGSYLGTLEVSQDLTAKRKLEGEQRLLTYIKEK